MSRRPCARIRAEIFEQGRRAKNALAAPLSSHASAPASQRAPLLLGDGRGLYYAGGGLAGVRKIQARGVMHSSAERRAVGRTYCVKATVDSPMLLQLRRR